MSIGERLLTVGEVAQMLGVSVAFVYQHAGGSRRPRIPCVKIGRSLRFRLSAIEELIRSLEQAA
jgi:excisionase family DNA binding protein